MGCRGCGAALTEGARFCASCGLAIVATCSSCGTELPDGARFCPACGTAADVDAAPAAPPAGRPSRTPAREGGRERKVATLLFADIVGFTSMNEAHDPELVSTLVSRVFERLAQEVERYG